MHVRKVVIKGQLTEKLSKTDMDMTKKYDAKAVSTKNTKEQILAAYNEVLTQLSEKQAITPQEENKQEEQQKVVTKAIAHAADDILNDLSALKSKAIKQVDGLAGHILHEFEKLSDLREAIAIEQEHLQRLYQINETANTLSALLQAQGQQKEQFQVEMERMKKAFEEEMELKKSTWQQERKKLEQEYQEQKEAHEKARKREEEEYRYNLELNRRKELEEYNTKRANAEKELAELKEKLLKREAELVEKEQNYETLRKQVEQIPMQIKGEVEKAEKLLANELLQKYEFESQLKEREYGGTLQLKEQSISYLEEKIRKQEEMIKELTARADLATEQVQSIACRALDASAQRYTNPGSGKTEEKTS